MAAPSTRPEVGGRRRSAAAALLRWIRQPLSDFTAAVERQMLGGPQPLWTTLLIAAGMVATWFVYVPIHELMHALACLATGGQVTELQVAPLYGGRLLARVFPFVVAGGDYPGRLSGFDTGGSDLVYLATDAAPYLLTVLLGVPLLRLCVGRRRPLLFGAAFVLALIPFSNVTGDYYEMGSVLSTNLLTRISGGGDIAFAAIRGDDLIKLVGELAAGAPPLRFDSPSATMAAATLMAVSTLLGIALAFVTYAAGRRVAALLLREPGPQR